MINSVKNHVLQVPFSSSSIRASHGRNCQRVNSRFYSKCYIWRRWNTWWSTLPAFYSIVMSKLLQKIRYPSKNRIEEMLDNRGMGEE